MPRITKARRQQLEAQMPEIKEYLKSHSRNATMIQFGIKSRDLLDSLLKKAEAQERVEVIEPKGEEEKSALDMLLSQISQIRQVTNFVDTFLSNIEELMGKAAQLEEKVAELEGEVAKLNIDLKGREEFITYLKGQLESQVQLKEEVLKLKGELAKAIEVRDLVIKRHNEMVEQGELNKRIPLERIIKSVEKEMD